MPPSDYELLWNLPVHEDGTRNTSANSSDLKLDKISFQYDITFDSPELGQGQNLKAELVRLLCHMLLSSVPNEKVFEAFEALYKLLQNDETGQDRTSDPIAIDMPEDEEHLDVFATEEEIEEDIAYYERKFGMSSETFLQLVREGKEPDEEGIIDWKLLLEYR